MDPHRRQVRRFVHFLSTAKARAAMSALRTAGVLAALAAYVYALAVRRARGPRPSAASQRLLASGRKRLLRKLLDVGGFFGIDIGGTLCKLIFFLPDKDLTLGMLRTVWPQQDKRAQCEAKLKSVHALAGFILSRDRYGKTGVRDTHLSFSLPGMGGEFHFIRFETRRMEGALKLASRNGLAEGMHNICATGGGAVKVRRGRPGSPARARAPPLPLPCPLFTRAHSHTRAHERRPAHSSSAPRQRRF